MTGWVMVVPRPVRWPPRKVCYDRVCYDRVCYDRVGYGGTSASAMAPSSPT